MYAFECFTNFWTRLERSKLVEARYGEIWDGGCFRCKISAPGYHEGCSSRHVQGLLRQAGKQGWLRWLRWLWIVKGMWVFDTWQTWHARSLVQFISFFRIFVHIRALHYVNVSEIMCFCAFFAGLVDVFRTAIMQSTGPAEAHADERRWAARWDYEPLRCEMDARHGCTFFLGPDLCALHHSQFCIVFFLRDFFLSQWNSASSDCSTKFITNLRKLLPCRFFTLGRAVWRAEQGVWLAISVASNMQDVSHMFFAISMSLNVRGLTECLQKEEDAEVKAIGGKMDSCRHSIRCIDAILVGLHASRVKRMNNFVFFARCAPVPRPLSSPNLFQF